MCILASMYGGGVGFMQGLSAFYGRFWYYFPQLSVCINDACAFFAGITFGKTKLISLSPNKTVEGFVGGLICNVIGTLFFV